MIRVSKKQSLFVQDLLRELVKEGVISEETSGKIRSSINEEPFDWRRVTRYAIWASVIAILIAVATLFSMEPVVDFVSAIFKAPEVGFTAIFSLAAIFMFFLAYRRRLKSPTKRWTNEGVLFLGVVFLFFALNSLGLALQLSAEGGLNLLLFSSILFAALGVFLQSGMVFGFSLLLFGGYFGAETGYVSGFGAYWLGINYPVRFLLFGAALTLAAFALRNTPVFRPVYAAAKNIGLLYCFIPLWILSIFGNYGDMDAWSNAGKFELLHWSLLFLAASIVSVYIGVKYSDQGFRGFGLTFLFINLYTRFFEHFWDKMPMALFFALLGASFWLLGAYAERIWIRSGSLFNNDKNLY